MVAQSKEVENLRRVSERGGGTPPAKGALAHGKSMEWDSRPMRGLQPVAKGISDHALVIGQPCDGASRGLANRGVMH